LPVNAAASLAHNWYLLACVAGTVFLLLLLIVWLRLHAALGLSIAAVALGIASGMPLTRVPLSFTAGVGTMMGHIAIILGMGAILGQLLASSGGAASLGRVLVEVGGPRGLPWALLGLGIVVGMPVFFEVGLVLLMPIIVESARRSGRPPILVGLPVLAGLSIMHGLIPPHPSAMLAATLYHADVGRTIFWGLVVGIPAAALAGPVLGWFLIRLWERKQAWLPAGEGASIGAPPPEAQQLASASSHGPAPAGAVAALVAILLPIALIFVGSWADNLAAPGSVLNGIMHLAGSPDVAMVLAVLVALVTLGRHIPVRNAAAAPGDGSTATRTVKPLHRGEMLRRLTADSFGPIAGVLVILAAAGALSGVLRDSGAAQATVGLAMRLHMPALLLAWAMAAVVRVCMGSATVATAVTAGVLAPMAGHLGVNPELLVLATGSGSLILSHVNDSGFWLVGSLFELDAKQTLSTWSVLETLLSLGGLAATLLLSIVLH
jgi:gluconate:H+ symporter, GntP family